MCPSPVVSGRHVPSSRSSPPALRLVLSPLLHVPEPWEESFDEGIPFKTECSEVSHSERFPVVSHRVNSHLMWEEA